MKTIAYIITISFSLAIAGCCPTNETEKHTAIPPRAGHGETFYIPGEEVVAKLNKDILSMNITKPEDIAALYRPRQTETEGRYSYTVYSTVTSHNQTEITVVEEGLADDAVEGVKTVLVITKNNNAFRVISIKENYKCYRGHKAWSSEKCL